MKAHERVVFALDVPNASEAVFLIDKLRDHVGYFKVGLELFISCWGNRFREGDGKFLLSTIPKGKLILDLKLHDIPETVERAIMVASMLQPAFITIHVQQRETLERAVKAAEKNGVRLLGVTVLTSMNELDLLDLRMADATTRKPSFASVNQRVYELAYFALGFGVDGFVCSPEEVKHLRELLNRKNVVLMVPGIRPSPRYEVRDGERKIGEFNDFNITEVRSEHVMTVEDVQRGFDVMRNEDVAKASTTVDQVSHALLSGRRPFEPEMQQIPVRTETGKQLRKVFQASTVMPDADYTSLEERVREEIAYATSEEGEDAIARGIGIPKEYLRPKDDQKRVGTPAQAIRDGADLLVIGRPIRDAQDPVEAAKAIAVEIEEALK